MEKFKKHYPQIQKVLLLLISFILSIVCIFIFDKILGQKKDKSKLTENRTAVYRTPEFTFTATTNSNGFRGKDFDYAKKANTVRILAVGDSFTYCWGVDYENCWVSILEKYLNKDSNRKYEIVNLGIPGASLYDYLESVKKYVPLYKPDYVFVGIVEGNDFVQLVTSPDKKIN